MAGTNVPRASLAIVGGTGTYGADLHAELHPDVAVRDEELVFATPWGESPAFTLLEVADRKCLHVRLHGWRRGVSRGRASRQVFSVLQRAGVRRIVSDAGVGSLNTLLDPGDLVIPDDFVDLTTDRDRGGMIVGDHLLIMRDPVCPLGRETLRAVAADLAPERRLFPRGTYVVTEGPRFESPAEVRRLQQYGDIVGQSFAPEVWLARDIGACYAGIYVVVNYGEGVVTEWSHDELKRIFEDDSKLMARIILAVAAAWPEDDEGCDCRALRRPSLLK